MYNICTILDQRRSRWADVIQMLYKSFAFPGYMVYSNRIGYFHTIFAVLCMGTEQYGGSLLLA